MEFTFRLVGTDAVDKPVRVNTNALPEMTPYLKDGERLFLVPTEDAGRYADMLRKTGATVHVGASEPSMRNDFNDAIFDIK